MYPSLPIGSWITGRHARLAAALVAVIAALALRIAFSWTSLSQLPATGDESLVVLVAKRVANGEWPLLLSDIPYQIPFESYLMVPLLDWMPRNAIGARYVTLSFGVAALAVFLYTAVKLFPRAGRWTALALVLFPSGYWLMIQSAYAPPLYPTVVLMFAAAALFLTAAQDSPSRPWWIAGAGLACGIGFSAHMLALQYLLPAALVATLTRSPADSVKSGVAFALGAAIGLAPFALSVVFVPHAHHAVAGTVTLEQALRFLWNPVLKEIVPGALGADPPLFPDFPPHLGHSDSLRTAFTYMYFVFIVLVAGNRLWAFLLSIKRHQWPSLEVIDFFVLTAIASIISVGFSSRAHGQSYRYVLIAVICTPFLVAYAYQAGRGFVRALVGLVTVSLVVFDIVVSVQLIKAWIQPGFAGDAAFTPKIDRLINRLDERGIDRCYASFWLAYRVEYETDGRILCVPPFNERFLGWPMTDKGSVDQAPGAAYVLTNGYGSRYPTRAFKRDMHDYGIAYKKESLKPFSIFTDFGYRRSRTDRAVAVTRITARAGDNEVMAGRLADGDHSTAWSSGRAQRQGMWVELELDELTPVDRVTLFYPFPYPNKPKAMARSITLLGRQDAQWSPIRRDIAHHFDRLRFLAGHPVYGGMHQTIWFKPVNVDALRVVIEKPHEGRQWILGEIEIGAYVPLRSSR